MLSIDYGQEKGLLVAFKKGDKGLLLLKKDGKIMGARIGQEIQMVDFGQIVLE